MANGEHGNGRGLAVGRRPSRGGTKAAQLFRGHSNPGKKTMSPVTWLPLPTSGREATRTSFVERLRNWRDDVTWGQFMARYGRLVRHVALQAGLRPEEAEDVVQETVYSVARKMPEFEYDRERCSLEGWIRHVTQLRIKDQLRRRIPVGGVEHERRPTHSESLGTEWMHALPDARQDGERDAAWDAAWRQNVLDRAMERVQLRVSPAHYQMFCLSVIDGRPGPEVARTLGVSLASVYVVRHRVLRLLRAEVEQMRATPGGLG